LGHIVYYQTWLLIGQISVIAEQFVLFAQKVKMIFLYFLLTNAPKRTKSAIGDSA